MKRLIGVSAAVLIGAGSLTACSGDSEYCDTWKSHQNDFTSAMSNPTGATSVSSAFKDIASKAPSELKSKWDAVLGMYGPDGKMIMNDLNKVKAGSTAMRALASDAQSRCS